MEKWHLQSLLLMTLFGVFSKISGLPTNLTSQDSKKCPEFNHQTMMPHYCNQQDLELGNDDDLCNVIIDYSIQLCSNDTLEMGTNLFSCPLTTKNMPPLTKYSKVLNSLSLNASCIKMCANNDEKCSYINMLVMKIQGSHLKKKTAISSVQVSSENIKGNDLNNFPSTKKVSTVIGLAVSSNISGKKVPITESVAPPLQDNKAKNPPILSDKKKEMQQVSAGAEKMHPSTSLEVKLPTTVVDENLDESVPDKPPPLIMDDKELAQEDDGEITNPESSQEQFLEEKIESPLSDLKEENNVITPEKHTLGGGEFVTAEDSHFFFYFLTFTCLTVIGYIAFHNKNKIFALALEGRRGRGGSRRRPNSASYRKLDTSLEEAMMSHPSSAPTSHVIY